MREIYHENFKFMQKRDRHQKMERHYCLWVVSMNIVKNDNSEKIYLQIQCTPNQNPHPFFKETEKEQYSTLRMEPQKNHVQPKNSEQKEQCSAD